MYAVQYDHVFWAYVKLRLPYAVKLMSILCLQNFVSAWLSLLSIDFVWLHHTKNNALFQLLTRWTYCILLQVQEPVDEVYEFYFEEKPKFDPKLSGLGSNVQENPVLPTG